MYDVLASKHIGGHDEVSFVICPFDVVRDVAVHDSMGNMVESGLVVVVYHALVTRIHCGMAGGFSDCGAVGTNGAAINSKNHSKVVRILV